MLPLFETRDTEELTRVAGETPEETRASACHPPSLYRCTLQNGFYPRELMEGVYWCLPAVGLVCSM